MYHPDERIFYSLNLSFALKRRRDNREMNYNNVHRYFRGLAFFLEFHTRYIPNKESIAT